LWHGSKGTPSDVIYKSDEGLDMRFSRDGYYGQGIYFADSAQYSHTYARPEQGCFELFLVFVLAGNAIKFPNQDRTLRMPPNLPDGSFNRYDSVMNNDQSHTIIYNNQRQMPAFLIKYQHGRA
jgi:hypothetical protein